MFLTEVVGVRIIEIVFIITLLSAPDSPSHNSNRTNNDRPANADDNTNDGLL